MSIDNVLALPEGWLLQGTNKDETAYWVQVNLDNFKIWCSGGNEQVWYVDQWWMEDGDKDITGQRPTLEDAIDTLRRYLAGESVPNGDEITVAIMGEEPIVAPIYHNSKGDQFVSVRGRS